MKLPLVFLKILLSGIFSLVIAVWIFNSALPVLHPFFDNHRSAESWFKTDPKGIVYGQKIMSHCSGKKIFITGSSTARDGLRPTELNLKDPYDIYNVAVGASNITQIRDIYDDLHSTLEHCPNTNPILILGLWYGLLVSDKKRWQGEPTSLEVEKLRYGLAKRHADGSVKWVLGPLTTFAKDLVNLGLFIRWKENEWAVKLSFRSATPAQNSSSKTLSWDKRREAIRGWEEHLGWTIEREQVDVLMDLVKKATTDGWRVVIVDLAIPKWHQDDAFLFAEYQQKKAAWLEALQQIPQTSYINLQDINDNWLFDDAVHLNDSWTWLWGQRLSEHLNKSVL